MKTAEIAARPLAGLDEKLKQATVDADKFYAQRLPYSYSEVAGELGALAKKTGVKLTREQYAQAPVLGGRDCAADGGEDGCEPERRLSAAGAVHQWAGAGQDIFPDTRGGTGWAAEWDGGGEAGVDDLSAGSGGSGGDARRRC